MPVELSMVCGAIFLYFFVRGLTEGGVAEAVAHAEQILRFERALGLDVELAAQRAVAGHDWMVTGANWVYIWGHWPVIVGTLVWLGRTRPAVYRLLRNAMFVSGGIGLVIFALYPVAPPRLIDRPFVDTVTELSNSYRVLQPPALVNKYAALPSLHVGWNFLVGLFVWRYARASIVRWAGALSPVLMVAAVVLTANHYVVDAVAGIVIAALGVAIASAVGRRPGSASAVIVHRLMSSERGQAWWRWPVRSSAAPSAPVAPARRPIGTPDREGCGDRGRPEGGSVGDAVGHAAHQRDVSAADAGAKVTGRVMGRRPDQVRAHVGEPGVHLPAQLRSEPVDVGIDIAVGSDRARRDRR